MFILNPIATILGVNRFMTLKEIMIGAQRVDDTFDAPLSVRMF
jgi:hypothetical protein